MQLRKRVRISGKERARLRVVLARRYEKGESIRQLAEAVGRSYGFIHRLLSEAENVELRGRGGANTTRR